MKKTLLLLTLIIGITAAAFAQGNCLQFNASDEDDIVLVHNYNPGSNSVTVEAWVYCTSYTDWGSIVKNWGVSNHGQFHFGLKGGGSGYLDCVIAESGGGNIDVTDPVALPLNSWQHVAFVADAATSTLHLYRNGIEVANSTYDGTLLNTFSHLGIGQKTNDDGTGVPGTNPGPWKGNIDEVRIWTTARTADEIQQNMCTEISDTTTGLYAYYRFSESVGTTLPCLVNSPVLNGTLQNMAGTEWAASTAFNTWRGLTDTDWHTTANWSRGSVPVAADNVGIPNSRHEPTTTGNSSCNLLEIGPGATLTVSPSTTLTVSGNIFVFGTFANNGTVDNQ